MQRKHFWLITLVMVIGIMVMIFLFSGENADLSSEKSSFITEYLIEAVGKLLPAAEHKLPVRFTLDFLENIIRKCAHFMEYALLSFFVNLHFYAGELLCIAGECTGKDGKKESGGSGGYQRLKQGLSGPVLRSLCAILFCVLYAGTDELHQYFVPGRACRLFDVGIDTLGAIFGMLLFLTLPEQKVTM